MSGKPFGSRQWVPALLVPLFLAGCLSPQKKVAQQMPAIQARWQAEVSRHRALPERRLNWPEALALLERDNLKLRAARVDITNAHELARQVLKDLIPTIDLRSGVSRSLDQIPMTSFRDVTFSLDSFFNIPGVVSLDGRLFAARLAVLRAQAAYELARREQTVELYKAFLEARENEETAAGLQSERKLADSIGKADELAGEVMNQDIQTQHLTLEKSGESLQTRIGELLNNQQFRWTLGTNGLPEFDYESRPLPLADPNRVARLQMQLVAIELVGAWAQIHGIKLQYWPEVTIFVSSPSAFQVLDGQSHFWSASDVVASANLFWSLDTRGDIALQLRQTRREQELEKERLQQDSQELIDRLVTAQRMAGSLRRQIEQLDRLASLMEGVPSNPDFDSLMQAAANNRSLRSQRSKLRRDLAEVNTLFWFVDEQKWASARQ